ncbi:MAG: protoporphyrinogen oxidase [Myxococcales bacterium]|nr:MAG: protoporphyrinogen oxidase [Myxococcales bacterium]
MIDVLVVGGGVSGLACAWALKTAGLAVKLLEAEETPGGNLRTVQDGAWRYELGPHSFLPSSDAIWTLIEKLQIEERVAAAASASQARFIFKNGRLMPLPTSPWAFIATPLLSAGGKFRLLAEPFVKGGASERDTAREFFRRRLGDEATEWIIGPFVSGIYAGDPARLGARDAFPKMWRWERDAGSMIRGARRYLKRKRIERGARAKRKGLFSFQGGLGELTGRLAGELGPACQSGEGVTAVERKIGRWLVQTEAATYEAKRLVVAVPPLPAARLLAPVSASLALALSQVEMAPVAVVHVGVTGEAAAAVPDGFGYLVPRGLGLRTLGCVFVSKLFAGRAPEGGELLTFYLGGALDPEAARLDDAALVALALDEFAQAVGPRLAPAYVKVLRHPQAIPQLTVGHVDRIAALLEQARGLGALDFAGNYLTGVGMNDAAQSGLDAAERILAARRPKEEQTEP